MRSNVARRADANPIGTPADIQLVSVCDACFGRESKLTQLVRDSLCGGASGCSACMIAHVSAADHAYIETVQVVQLAARLCRIKVRRRNKVFSATSVLGYAI